MHLMTWSEYKINIIIYICFLCSNASALVLNLLDHFEVVVDLGLNLDECWPLARNSAQALVHQLHHEIVAGPHAVLLQGQFVTLVIAHLADNLGLRVSLIRNLVSQQLPDDDSETVHIRKEVHLLLLHDLRSHPLVGAYPVLVLLL